MLFGLHYAYIYWCIVIVSFFLLGNDWSCASNVVFFLLFFFPVRDDKNY